MPQNSSRIVFFGTSDFAVPALKSLVSFGFNVVSVVTQPEKAVGRAKVVMPSPVKKAALELSIPVHEPHNLKTDEEFFKSFRHLNPDVCVITSYGKIIPQTYLDIPPFGFLNIHPSLLPKYRGPSPIQSAIMNGDDSTAVSLMRIDAGMDSGPILGTVNYELPITDNYKKIEENLAKIGAELLVDIFPKYIAGEIQLKEQDPSRATFTKKLEREDGKIDWTKEAREIYNLIRALEPEPGAWTMWKGKVLNIRTAEVLEINSKDKAGTIIRVDSKIVVATSKCYLNLKQIQLEGGKEMDAKAFLNGHPDFQGSELG